MDAGLGYALSTEQPSFYLSKDCKAQNAESGRANEQLEKPPKASKNTRRTLANNAC
jgi:hypothetical protein